MSEIVVQFIRTVLVVAGIFTGAYLFGRGIAKGLMDGGPIKIKKDTNTTVYHRSEVE